MTDRAGLGELEPAWYALFARVPEAPPFLSPAWLLPWWDCFSPGTLASVAVWEGARLVGLAPLYTEEGPWGRRLLPLGIGLSDGLDLLLDPACADAAAATLVDALAGAGGAWDCWSAEEAPPGAAVLACPDPPGWRSDTAPQGDCPVLRLDGEAGGGVPAGQRRKLRMARHRAARRDMVLAEATPATLAGDLDALFRLHAARWESRGEGGVLADPVVRRFHRAAAPRLLAAGLLRLTVLRLDGRVAGVFYGLRHGGVASAYLGGFDPAFAFESPGTLLIGAAIEAARTEGAHAFSFLRGREAYKYAWGATDRPNSRRTFRPVA